MNMQVLDMPRDRSDGYKVDVSRGERIGRVSSEWFSRPVDERFLSLGALREALPASPVPPGSRPVSAMSLVPVHRGSEARS